MSGSWLCCVVGTVETRYRSVLWYDADSYVLKKYIADADREALWKVSLL